jgi:hypothetical protein
LEVRATYKLYDFKIVASFPCPSISEPWPQFFLDFLMCYGALKSQDLLYSTKPFKKYIIGAK